MIFGKESEGMQKVNKRDIIDEVSEKAHISKKDSENAMQCILDIMEKALLEGKEVNFTNFGTFTPKSRKQRDGTDPKKHTRIVIKETRTVSFKPAKVLKEKLNK